MYPLTRALAAAALLAFAAAPRADAQFHHGAATPHVPPPLSPHAQLEHEPIVRVPIAPPPLHGRETDLGRGQPAACLDAGAIASATVLGDRTIEIELADGERWHMSFAADCPFLGFYGGFYYRRSIAGRLCAGRDSVIARSGGECAIDHIRKHKDR